MGYRGSGAKRRKRKPHRGTRTGPMPAAVHLSRQTDVSIDWRVLPRREWNSMVDLSGRVAAIDGDQVVYGIARNQAGEQLTSVFGPVGSGDDLQEFIDDVLSPAMDRELDRIVGPLRWKSAVLVAPRVAVVLPHLAV